MILAWLLLLTGLIISAVAIYYSVIGLTAIFSAAVIPIIVMGSALEVGKLVCASWLKANWERAPAYMKYYMILAVAILMLITSMGIFGFLSKAHTDQNLVSGDVQSKIAIYDEKIKTARENIETNRRQLKQMDEAVDQVMGRSQDEKGADKAVSIRKAQSRDRSALAKDIEANQKLIATLNDQAAPIRAEVRKVEAEVGPIKYIAAFIYGETNEGLLEKAVTWVIILIVIVFDPLAVIMLLAAQMTFGWLRQQKQQAVPNYEPDNGPLTSDQIEQLKEMSKPPAEETKSEFDTSKHAYLHEPFSHFKDLKPMVYKPEVEKKKDDFEFLAKYEEITPTPTLETVTVDTTDVKVDEPTYQILPELDEESKKKSYMIKQGEQQIVKTKN